MMRFKHACLGACLGWIAAAGWSAPHWFAAVAVVVAIVYYVEGAGSYRRGSDEVSETKT